MKTPERYFKDAMNSCQECKKLCEQSGHYEDNEHSMQAQVFLGEVIKKYGENELYMKAAQDAESACKSCDHKSTRIKSFLETSEINFKKPQIKESPKSSLLTIMTESKQDGNK